MVKAYLRYVHSASFGVISGAGALAYDAQTRLLAAAALEDVALWNVKQGTLVSVWDLQGVCCWPGPGFLHTVPAS